MSDNQNSNFEKGPLFPHKNSRRDFLKKSAAATAFLAGFDPLSLAANELSTIAEPGVAAPWYRRITRWGQVNITEKDPESYDVEWWRKYWKRTSTQGVVINAGGIVAYYPS